MEATILRAEPQLFALDLAKALEFYVKQLGFSVVFTYGAPAFYAQVERGGARLNLRRFQGPRLAPGFRSREPDALSATLVLDDARPLFDEFASKGIVFHQPLKTEPWGAQTFIVKDPDENLLCFSAGQGS